MPEKRYYVTTPIYYVNGVPHVGTATTTLLADATTRYRRLRGENAYFLTGTDEHAQKVVDAARASGIEPQRFVDDVSQRFVETWQYLGCRYDNFLRTSEPRHKRVVQEIFARLQAAGDVYLGVYEGWYSVSDETFFRDTDVDENGIVKETGAKVERIREDVHYFRLSAYGERLRAHILAQPDFLQPDTRRNEVLSFIDQGLRDIAISRKNAGWGIAVPGDPEKVIYVWFDALINYLTESGWPDDPNWTSLWPADVHLMAKEIYTRFHATLWPAMLLALGVPLPKHVVGHGWWTVGGEKGSKSKGSLPTPQEVVAQFQALSGADEAICKDALRYYLLRDIRFTDDAEYSFEMLVSRYNADLGNDLGNVLNRVLSASYFDGVIPSPRALDPTLVRTAGEALAGYEAALERFDWGAALQSAWTLLREVNRYLGDTAPWKLAKTGDAAGVGDAVYNALEGVRLAAYMASPVLPHAAAAIGHQLGIDDLATGDWIHNTRFGALKAGTQTGTPQVLFPRIDKSKLAPLPIKPMEPMETVPLSTDTVTIDDFARIQLAIADVIAAEKVPNADKLLRLSLKIGDEERQIVSGIAEFYTPEELVGRQIVVFTNLLPRKLRGIESKGMLLAANTVDDRAVLLMPDKPVPSGSVVR